MENYYWELIQQNADHIRTINAELGGILQRLSVLETKVNLILGLMTLLVGELALKLYNRARNSRSNKK